MKSTARGEVLTSFSDKGEGLGMKGRGEGGGGVVVFGWRDGYARGSVSTVGSVRISFPHLLAVKFGG